MNNIVSYINRLIESTKENKIPWKKLRDNIFIWQTETSENVKTNIILQKKIFFEKKSILFRLFEVDSKRILLDVNTDVSNDETRIAIENLFNVIENSSVNYELSVLDNLLNNLK